MLTIIYAPEQYNQNELKATSFIFGDKVIEYFDQESNCRLMISRGFGSFCAYIGIPVSPLYDMTNDFICHGGCTFMNKGSDDSIWDKNYYWFGWDYSHYGDYIIHEVLRSIEPRDMFRSKKPKRNRTIYDVTTDCLSVLAQFKIIIGNL